MNTAYYFTQTRHDSSRDSLKTARTSRSFHMGIIILAFIFFFAGVTFAVDMQDKQINDIVFKFNTKRAEKKAQKYELLLNFKRGDSFSYKNIRKSMENLYKIGSIDNIEVKTEQLPENRLNVIFDISDKFTIRSILLNKNRKIKKSSLINSIHSFRVGAYFNPDDINNALKETKNFLESRGYFTSRIEHFISKNEWKGTVTLVLIIDAGRQTRINKVVFTLPDRKLLRQVEALFTEEEYLPHQFPDKIQNIKDILKKQKYYFPEVEIKPEFLDETKTLVDLNVNVKAGFKHIFHFQGMKQNFELISSIWEKKRFEKWAEQESNARILYYLKNKGYIDAKIESDIKIKGSEKHLTFTVKKNRKYKLGKISFSGNDSIPAGELEKIITSDDKVFDILFWLRAGSLYVDLGVLEQFYHFHGFPLAEITMQLSHRRSKADIDFKIKEGEKFTVESILLDGNKFFDRNSILSFFKTRENSSFVQQVLNRDIEKLIRYYHSYGFDDVDISPEISPGTEKSILIKIKEGQPYKMGNMVVIGASATQEKLLKKLFPLNKKSHFNRDRVEQFREEIENSTIFNEVKIIRINKEPNLVDILVKVTPDRSKYYGFGVGWEDRKGLRGTVEYQGKDLFNSTSSLSAMVQFGINERRGLISYDTPYFFKNKINSSFKIWTDSEVYPSYSFNRYGFGESLIRKMTPNSYILASLSWYRSELKELYISEYGVDKLNVPFDTTAINFSYVIENRDDPFNPTSGDYFSSDIKVGVPLFEKSYSFIKFLWSYQRNLKFLKYGTLAFSVRNGFASGDMSITERFFAGGVHTFRGTKNDFLSPVDIVTGKPNGGNALVLFNFEATFPLLIIPMKDFYYSLFFDVGNVFEKVNDFDLARLERAIGFSLKIKTQMGPIRVDFGWNLHKRPEGNFEWNIGIGNVF